MVSSEREVHMQRTDHLPTICFYLHLFFSQTPSFLCPLCSSTQPLWLFASLALTLPGWQHLPVALATTMGMNPNDLHCLIFFFSLWMQNIQSSTDLTDPWPPRHHRQTRIWTCHFLSLHRTFFCVPLSRNHKAFCPFAHDRNLPFLCGLCLYMVFFLLELPSSFLPLANFVF